MKYEWSPSYELRTHKGVRPYIVSDVKCNECPASVLHQHPELVQLAAMESRNRHVKEATGATMFGADSSRWPALWTDVVTTAEQYRILEHNARMSAEQAAISQG